MYRKRKCISGVENKWTQLKLFAPIRLPTFSRTEYLNILDLYYKYNRNILLSLYDINYYLKNEKNLLQDIFHKGRLRLS